MDKKTIIITGATRGIGKQLALAYASQNSNLVLIARNEQQLEEVAQQCAQLGAKTIWKAIDVKDADALKAFLLEVDDKMPVDLIIANAGVASTLQPNWQEENFQDSTETFAINLHGVINTITPLLPSMIKRRRGQIAIMSSIAAFRGLPQSPSYCASKAAINIYGQSLRAWLSRYDVDVNVIFPGYVKTDMCDQLGVVPKPFLMSSKKAAKTIQNGLMKNKPCIVFPWQLNLLIKLTCALPKRLVDKILNQFDVAGAQ